MKEYRFRLYISNYGSGSNRTEKCLRELLDEHLEGRFHLEVVDVLREPETAETDKIMVVPTVFRFSPLPQRKIVGDLGDKKAVKWRLFE